MTTFEEVQPLADTVLYEGYALYPYRADDGKNRVRWQFGVLVPARVSAADRSERSGVVAQMLVEGRSPSVEVRARFLQVQRRTVQRRAGEAFEDVATLEAGDTAYLPFDEAVAREFDLRAAVTGLAGGDVHRTVEVAGGRSVEGVPGAGSPASPARCARPFSWRPTRSPGRTGWRACGPRSATTPPGREPPRHPARRSSAPLVAVHLVVRVEGGAFLS